MTAVAAGWRIHLDKMSLNQLQRLPRLLNSCCAGEGLRSSDKAVIVQRDNKDIAEHGKARAATKVTF